MSVISNEITGWPPDSKRRRERPVYLSNLSYMRNCLKFFIAGMIAIMCLPASAAPSDDPFWLKLEVLFARVELRNKNKEVVFSGQAFLEELKPRWKANRDLVAAEDEVWAAITRMQDRRLKPYEHIAPFLRTLTDLAVRNQTTAQVSGYLKGLDYLLSQPGSPQINEFLDNTRLLLSDSVLSRFKNITWKTSRPSFQVKASPAPQFVFDGIDLICLTAGSARKLSETSGVYDPLARQWKGFGGRTAWISGNKPSDSVFVVFGAYAVFLQGTDISADSVRLFHQGFFPAGIMGRYADNFRPGNRNDLPSFSSYDKNLSIPGISRNIDYTGGILFEGNTLTGVGEPGLPARLYFRTGYKGSITIRGQRFFFKPANLSACDAFATIRYQADSIYHPAISFNYDEKRRELTLYQGGSILSGIPFYDSYQRIEIQANALSWRIDDTLVSFRKGTGLVKESDAAFISENYYREDDFRALQGIDPVNPLIRLAEYSRATGLTSIRLQEYASHVRLSADQARLMILQLATRGFVLFDFDTQIITLRDKLFHWVDSFYARKDFDNLVVFSDSARTNAVLNLRNMDLQVFNVNQVILSDSQRVAITPYEYTLTMKENRNIAYSGRAIAGFFEFFSNRRNLFLYDEFRLSLPEIDSISFRAIDGKMRQNGGSQRPRLIRSVIEQVSGQLQIDHHANKSGRKNFKIPYPVFKTDSSRSYVYYDRGTFGQNYPRKTFFYRVEPFVMSNLDNFMLDSLDLKGTLFSAGIFSPLKMPLVVRPDYSLGVDGYTGKSGQGIYTIANQPKGWFTGRFDLSLNGFRGAGELKFLGSISRADSIQKDPSYSFLFYPEKAEAKLQSFELAEAREPVEMPRVTGRLVRLDWKPYYDNMTLTSIRQPFLMYGKTMTFDGTLSLSPRGLDGRGQAGFDKARLDSRYYGFGQKTLTADSSSFVLKTPDEKAIALEASNYNAFVDFGKGQAGFTGSGASKVDFPVFAFTSNHSRFDWDMTNKKIRFSSPGYESDQSRMQSLSPREVIMADENGSLSGPSFLSLRRDKDSLRFMAFSAEYDIESNLLITKEVPFVRSADALFFVPGRTITFTPEIKPIPVKGGSAITHRNGIFHELYDVNAEIVSGKKFNGTAHRYYTDERDGRNRFFLNQLASDPYTGITSGSGQIADTAGFMLNPYFAFHGDISFQSDRKALSFKGYYRISGDRCPGNHQPWVAFDTIIDPDKVNLPLPRQTFSKDFKELGAGLFIRRQGRGIYARFLQPLQDPRDLSLIRAVGHMTFNTASGEYRAGSPSNLENTAAQGNILSYDPTRCQINVKGTFELQALFSPVSKIRTTGTGVYDLQTDSLGLDLLLAFDFPFLRNAQKIMENDLYSADNPRVSISNGKYRQQLVELLGNKSYEDLMADVESSGGKAGTILNALLVLSDVNFVWDSAEQVFNCHGPVSVLFYNGSYIARKMDGYVQLIQKANAREDQLRILLRPDDNAYYYFDYGRGNILRVFSTNAEFTDAVVKAREEANKRFDKAHEGRRWAPYKIVPVNRSEAINFRAEMEKIKMSQ